MSISALQWVSECTVGRASAKAVLVALANFHHEKNGTCYASVSTLCAFTELNRKTIFPAIEYLEETGFIVVSRRSGAASKFTLVFDQTSPKNGTPTSTDIGTSSEIGTSPKNGHDPSQKRTKPVPILGHKQDRYNGNINPPLPPPEENLLQGVVALPTNRYGTDAEEVTITEQMRDEFQASYPALNVEQQLRAMRAWLIANPSNRKTANGMLRFVNGWLAREHNRRGPNHENTNQRPGGRQDTRRLSGVERTRLLREQRRREQGGAS